MTVTAIGSAAAIQARPDVSLEPIEDPSINVCFSTTNALISRWIRFVTRAPVSHALITFRSSTLDRVMVMEATGRGFNMVPWRRWRQRNTLVARFRVEASVRDQVKALQALSDDLGADYDRVSLFGFALRRWQKQTRNPLDDPRKLFCSEAVAKFLRETGVEECEDPARWTPADVFRHLLADPDRFPTVEEGEDMDRAVERCRRKK